MAALSLGDPGASAGATFADTGVPDSSGAKSSNPQKARQLHPDQLSMAGVDAAAPAPVPIPSRPVSAEEVIKQAAQNNRQQKPVRLNPRSVAVEPPSSEEPTLEHFVNTEGETASSPPGCRSHFRPPQSGFRSS